MPRHENQVNFDHSQKNKSIDPHNKTSHFRTAHKNQVNFDTHTKTKLIYIHTLKPSHFRPAHSQFRPPAKKTSQFRSIH